MKWNEILIGLIVIVLFFSGCLYEGDEDSVSITKKADVVLVSAVAKENFSFELGYYTRVTLTIKNEGDAPARNVKIYMYVENQNGKKEFDNTFYVTNNLWMNETLTKSVIVDSWQNDTMLKAKIQIIWDGGSNTYWRDWWIK